MEEGYYHYALIEDALNEEYMNTKVRVLGSVSKIDPQNRIIILESHRTQIECDIPQQYISQLRSGNYIQVLGTVLPGSPLQRISVKIVRQMNGIDEEAYNFAVIKYKEFVSR